jgi:hemoglobin
MKDIETLEDCRDLVEGFYAAARTDALLGPVFEARLARSWPEHLNVMTHFWSTILFARSLYHGNPLSRHVGLPLTAAHFSRWVELWRATVDARYEGPRATHAKDAASRMAGRMAPALRVPNAELAPSRGSAPRS